MDESVVKNLLMKPSQAIREGAKLVVENKGCYLHQGCGCAVGMMAAACGVHHIGGITHANAVLRDKIDLHNVDLVGISNIHSTGRMTAAEIADMLELEGH